LIKNSNYAKIFPKNPPKTPAAKSGHYTPTCLAEKQVTGLAAGTTKIKDALLIGTLIEQGFDPNTIIHSDGAGQFNVFVHSLCWKHAERPLLNVKSYNGEHDKKLNDKKIAYWSLYRLLCEYKKSPCQIMAHQLDQAFNVLCTPVKNYESLNIVLQDIQKKKDQLMLVLYRPETSLHNNDSERDIRELAKRRKISSGTRSENGKMSRDTFLLGLLIA